MKLSRVFATIREDLKIIDRYVTADLKLMRSKYLAKTRLPLSFSPVEHLFLSRGKSLRPGLMVLTAGALSGSIDTPYCATDSLQRAAGVVELIHYASLIHDDVIDESVERRKVASVHRKYGVKVAILAGDILFSHSFSVLGSIQIDDADKVRLFALFAELAKQMCFGEMLEQQHANGTDSLEEYLHIINLKTASLMSAGCTAGAIIAGGNEEEVKIAGDFGYEFGIAYQLIDDEIDDDSIYRGEVGLREEAERHLILAKNHVKTLNGSENLNAHSRGLYDLCDWVKEMG